MALFTTMSRKIKSLSLSGNNNIGKCSQQVLVTGREHVCFWTTYSESCSFSETIWLNMTFRGLRPQ